MPNGERQPLQGEPRSAPRFGHEAFDRRQAAIAGAIRRLAEDDVPCEHCGHSLLGIRELICPECGARVDPAWVNPHRRPVREVWTPPFYLSTVGCTLVTMCTYLALVMVAKPLRMHPHTLVLGFVLAVMSVILTYLSEHSLEPSIHPIRTLRCRPRNDDLQTLRRARAVMWITTYAATPVFILIAAAMG
ncbi:MAG: hypothetical protein AAGA55_00310 [Planctomycetota bacterium]